MDMNTNLSFAGCGFIGVYYVGVSACLKKFAPHLLKNKIGGASAGSLAALALVCDLPLAEVTKEVVMVAFETNGKKLGPFNPKFNLHKKIKSILNSFPEDIAEKSNGRLHISLTQASKMKNLLISEFQSKEDLVDAVCASSFVPLMSGVKPPRFRGKRVLDGLYSDNIPHLGGNTITVSPFKGNASISPKDDRVSSMILNIPYGSGGSMKLSSGNMKKLRKALLPPNTRKMKKICEEGFLDAMRFLQKEKLIRCQSCLELHYDVSTDFLNSCEQCDTLIQSAKEEKIPDEIVKVFDEVEELEKSRKDLGLSNLSLSSQIAINSTASLMTNTRSWISKMSRSSLSLFNDYNEASSMKGRITFHQEYLSN